MNHKLQALLLPAQVITQTSIGDVCQERRALTKARNVCKVSRAACTATLGVA
jgi:hypothetical protein